MASYLYANATSLFDYSNGASKSLKLLFENLAKNGDSVFVVCGFTSNCRLAFNYNKNIATRLSNIYNVDSENIIRFKLNGVYYSLIKTNIERHMISIIIKT